MLYIHLHSETKNWFGSPHVPLSPRYAYIYLGPKVQTVELRRLTHLFSLLRSLHFSTRPDLEESLYEIVLKSIELSDVVINSTS